MIPDVGMTKHKPNHDQNQTSKNVRVKPHRNGDVADEKPALWTVAKHPENYCERRRWKRGREERGRISLETWH
jgi:hypothetical protein